MKRIIALFTILLVLSSLFAVCACAEGDAAASEPEKYGVAIAVSTDAGSLKIGDTFNVTATVTEVNDPSGLAVLEYFILYDKDLLKLVDTKLEIPDIWSRYIGTDDFTDLSVKLEDDDSEIEESGKAGYKWALVSIKVDNALHDGGKAAVSMKFEVIGNGNAEVEFAPGCNTNDDMKEITANSVTLNLKTGDDESQKSVDISGNVGDVTENGKSNTVWIIVGLAVLFVAVLLAVYLFVRKKQK